MAVHGVRTRWRLQVLRRADLLASCRGAVRAASHTEFHTLSRVIAARRRWKFGLAAVGAIAITACSSAAQGALSTPLPGWDGALIDATGIDGGQAGAFNTASPPVVSRSALRLTITLNPTSDMKASPTLIHWQVKSDCPPAE
jgi:hypothetical protein